MKRQLDEIKKIRGRGTELVTIYVPSNYDINALKKMVEQEWSTAQNIKSDITRKNVQTALEKIMHALRHFKEVPPNGLVIFSGNIAGRGEKPDYRIWIIEPPIPSTLKIYRCDSTFLTEPLEKLLSQARGCYGLVVVDTKEATFGILRGKKIDVIKRERSLVPGKTRKGGSSAPRFQRVRENLLRDWLKKVSYLIKDLYLGIEDLKGIIIGGPGPIKEMLYEEYIDAETKKKILGVVDTCYTDEYGLKEILQRGSHLLSGEEIIKEKKIVNSFFEHIAKDDGLAVYGEDETMKMLEFGALSYLLISEDYDPEKIREFIRKAKEYGTQVFIVSKDTEEGAQFSRFCGIGGILRFKM